MARLRPLVLFLALVVVGAVAPTGLFTARAQAPVPLAYTIRFPDTASHSFTVEIMVPTDRREAIDLMMPVWSPGFYGLQNYGDRVSDFRAWAAHDAALDAARTNSGRWTVMTGGRTFVWVSYTVA